MKKSTVIILMALAVAVPASGLEADTAAVVTVAQRIARHSDMMRTMAREAYDNPAVRQWEQPYDYSAISADYDYSGGNRAVDVQRGKGSAAWGFTADSYIKHKSSTLWGSASYRNGRRRGVCWNESSDADMIYPYFTADSIGGDMRMETYSFAGGYADHNDRWAWGASASYDAGLYYRNVDPRPRNTTGRLDIAAGGAVRIGNSDYHAGISAGYRKYKQSCDIEFVNELSDNRIWHLTGLGTHYERFAGLGYSHYYNGHRWGATANLFPSSRRGAVASVEVTSFRFDHILTALNKLPLQSATDNRLSASAGWLAPGRVHDFAATVSLTHGKRIGSENIFGDPAASIYPQLGSLSLYRHIVTEAGVNLLWQWRPERSALLSVNPRVEWNRSDESYADPHRRLLLSSVAPAITVKGARTIGGAWHAAVSVDVACTLPVDNICELPYNGSIPAGMQSTDIRRYDILSRSHTLAGVRADISRAVSDRYALGFSVSYFRSSYTQGVHADCVDASLSFIF
ncbi:MAG: hypothetical protein K2G06_08350 [Muribaculaceae bacterium]|nr:hypothetical protein [Muribaculaceae bacterium]